MGWRKRQQPDQSKPTVSEIGLEAQQNLFDQIEDGLILINPDRKIEAFNRAAQHMTGWTKTDALGLNFKTIVSLTSADEPGLQGKQPPARRGYPD